MVPRSPVPSFKKQCLLIESINVPQSTFTRHNVVNGVTEECFENHSCQLSYRHSCLVRAVIALSAGRMPEGKR